MIFEIFVIFTALMVLDIYKNIQDPDRNREKCIIYDN